MRVFVTGANGWVGSMVVRDLIDAGHDVVGLVRSQDKGEAIRAAGATTVVGSSADLDVLRDSASDADGIIHLAFGLDLSRIVELAAEDRRAVETFGEALRGSERPFVAVSGFGLAPRGTVFDEDDRPAPLPDFPRATEQAAFALADRGLRASVVRLPRSVHGQGETHGFVPMLAAVAREKRVSAWVGDGHNLWPAVHRLDAARVFRLALERGACGAAWHAVAEEGVPFRRIAEAIALQVGVPAGSLTPAEAATHFGALAPWVAGNGPASSERTRTTLGWRPERPGLIADIDRPEYHRR